MDNYECNECKQLGKLLDAKDKRITELKKEKDELENVYIAETQLSAELASRNSREIADLKAENNRYKEALQLIANVSRSCNSVTTAIKALKGNK